MLSGGWAHLRAGTAPSGLFALLFVLILKRKGLAEVSAWVPRESCVAEQITNLA